MLFNSIDFAIFLPIVFVLYWLVFNRRLWLQNLLILVASYIFYGWWDWRFLSLIAFSTIIDYLVGIRLGSSKSKVKRKALLLTSILINLGLLGYFKYYNFFVENFVEAFRFFGSEIQISTLKIILPVGISFYTFQTLSYSIDIYQGKLQHTNNFVTFAAYVSFFPQLVAGPIERATNLLPQLSLHRIFDYGKAVDGLRQILWGLYKKIVIADNCARIANDIFDAYQDQSGSTLLLGVIFFTFQIYGDFSGYSDIAIGTSRLFGFSLMRNFAFPYFSRDIAEFWRRWHISLSTWFRDYLYIPLGGSKGGEWMKIRNTSIIFIVSGFWHGANWTFIAWGALNALYFLPLLLSKKNRINTNIAAEGKFLPSAKEIFQIGLTFFLTLIAWVFFRSDSISDALKYISLILSNSTLSIPDFNGGKTTLLFIGILIFTEWLQRSKQHALDFDERSLSVYLRYLIYYIVLFFIILFGGEQQEFIYFQF